MKRVRSEDAVRRAFQHGEQEPWTSWTRQHLTATYEPLLTERWILDMDATVKPLYGHQQQAVVGYNPRKPGRPSHVYHINAEILFAAFSKAARFGICRVYDFP